MKFESKIMEEGILPLRFGQHNDREAAPKESNLHFGKHQGLQMTNCLMGIVWLSCRAQRSIFMKWNTFH